MGDGIIRDEEDGNITEKDAGYESGHDENGENVDFEGILSDDEDEDGC